MYHNQAEYRLTGDTAWVKNREWLVYNPETNETLDTSNVDGVFSVADYSSLSKFALTHPDWKMRFLVKNDSASGCQTADFKKDLKGCAGEKLTELKLDHALEDYLREFSASLTGQQWDKVAPLTDNTTDTPLSTQLSDWTTRLADRKFTVMSADAYVTVNDKDYLAGKPFKVIFVWQLKNTETGGVRVVDTELTIKPHEDSFRWKYNIGELPQI